MEDSLRDRFDKAHALCLGFENFEKCEDSVFQQAIELFDSCVKEIQRESLFSPDEDVNEIDPQNLCYLLVPYF